MSDNQQDPSSNAGNSGPAGTVKDTLESYRQKAEALLKDVESHYPEWKAKATAAGSDALAKVQEFVASFGDKTKNFDTQYADLKSQASDKFDQLKAKAEDLWEEVKTTASKYTGDSGSGSSSGSGSGQNQNQNKH